MVWLNAFSTQFQRDPGTGSVFCQPRALTGGPLGDLRIIANLKYRRAKAMAVVNGVEQAERFGRFF